MKKRMITTSRNNLALLLVSIFLNTGLQAQNVGINTTGATPNASTIIDLNTGNTFTSPNGKGILPPNVALTGVTDIVTVASPAISLLVYNSVAAGAGTLAVVPGYYYWNGTKWTTLGATGVVTSLTNSHILVGNTSNQPTDVVMSGDATISNTGAVTVADFYNSAEQNSSISTTSATDNVIAGMSKTALVAGTYLVLFNSQCNIPAAYDTTNFSTAQGAVDLNLIYNDLNSLPVTNSLHPLTFGSGETITAGVYAVAGAASIAGILTLNGGGNPNSIFVIKANGAFNTGAGVNVVLTNGASACNVYWVAEGAIGLGAGTTLPGTLLAHGAAVAVGASCTISGRLFSTSGAISFGPGTIAIPSGTAFSINFRSLISFVIFTSSGGIANTGTSTYTGDITTDLGAITGFASATVIGTIYPPGSSLIITQVYPLATFSIFNNGLLVPNSIRTISYSLNTPIVYLQAITTVTVGQIIEVKWNIDKKIVKATNRILTLIKVGS